MKSAVPVQQMREVLLTQQLKNAKQQSKAIAATVPIILSQEKSDKILMEDMNYLPQHTRAANLKIVEATK